MVALASSAITDAEYDEYTQDLVITFRDGTSHVYTGVPQSVYDALLATNSPGTYFNRDIRNEYG